MSTAGSIRREFESRLLDDWHSLAVQLEIPEATKKTWANGREAAEIWVWLESRGLLRELAVALQAVERHDLAELVATLPPSSLKHWSAYDARRILGSLVMIMAMVALCLLMAMMLFPSKQRQLLAVTGPYDIANPAPFASLTPDGATPGLRALTSDLDRESSDNWFGSVFLTEQLPTALRKPQVEAEVRYGEDHARSQEDFVDIYWLASSKDETASEISVKNLTLDKGWARHQFDGEFSETMRIVVVFRHADAREHAPTVNIWIR